MANLLWLTDDGEVSQTSGKVCETPEAENLPVCYSKLMTKAAALSPELLKSISWDRPEMTSQKADSILNRPDDPEYYWLVGRMVERLSPAEVFSIIDKDRLYSMFPKLRIWKKWSVEKAADLFPEKYRQSD